jgi:hypothetical protein
MKIKIKKKKKKEKRVTHVLYLLVHGRVIKLKARKEFVWREVLGL